MDVCSGGELFNRIVEAGHYSEAKAAACFRTILQMLHACHDLGVVHRDLKPENFLLSAPGEGGQLKATDFGLSTFVKPGQELTEMVGSPYYVAPEVLAHRYGPECDVWSAGVILYILLCGLPPFWGESEALIFKAVKTEKPDFQEDPWPSISAGAKDLVAKLLCRDVGRRLTVAQALAHPWLQEGAASDAPLQSEVLSRMKGFANQNKFKQAGMMMLVKHLKKEELEGLHQLFLEMDTDLSGTITVDELRVGLEHHGAHLAKSELEALMEALDLHGSHSLTYDEFLAATIHTQKLESEENLHAAFHEFDPEDTGIVEVHHLTALLQRMGVTGTPEDILAMVEEVDEDHNGFIDYAEFVHMMAPRILGHCAKETAAVHRDVKGGLRTLRMEDVRSQDKRKA